MPPARRLLTLAEEQVQAQIEFGQRLIVRTSRFTDAATNIFASSPSGRSGYSAKMKSVTTSCRIVSPRNSNRLVRTSSIRPSLPQVASTGMYYHLTGVGGFDPRICSRGRSQNPGTHSCGRQTLFEAPRPGQPFTPSVATRTALKIAMADDEPWAITTPPLVPTRWAPPYWSGLRISLISDYRAVDAR